MTHQELIDEEAKHELEISAKVSAALEEAKRTDAPKPQILAGGKAAAIMPQSIDEAYRLAQALSRAGDMIPRDFQGNPDKVMAAIVTGMEIGMPPMFALKQIAVINGRASLWGDALPALVRRFGHQIDCVVTGEGDEMTATATLKRADTGETIVRQFSVTDAKIAGLWGKSGPWKQYPKRMLEMRARSWAVRDGAADCLSGLQVREEAMDMQPMRDVTPKTGFEKRALGEHGVSE